MEVSSLGLKAECGVNCRDGASILRLISDVLILELTWEESHRRGIGRGNDHECLEATA
jgi:hypothetical protein